MVQDPFEGFDDEVVDEALVGVGDVVTAAAEGLPGVAEGRVRVLSDPDERVGFQPGDVIVAPNVDVSWAPLVNMCSALVVQVPTPQKVELALSREAGIPCVVSVERATELFQDGAMVAVDGGAGTVTVLE